MKLLGPDFHRCRSFGVKCLVTGEVTFHVINIDRWLFPEFVSSRRVYMGNNNSGRSRVQRW